MHGSRKAPGFYTLAFLYVGCFALFYAAWWRQSLDAYEGPARLLWWLKATLELLASFYFFSVILKSCDYLLAPDDLGTPGVRPISRANPEPSQHSWPPIACIYLCAGDLDRRALESLCRLDYPGRYHVYVHDDSGDAKQAEEVERVVRDLTVRVDRPIFVLRRTAKNGGKPGAFNYILSRLGDRYPFLLVADNDSTALDPGILRSAIPLLEDPRVAAVQFRNVGVDVPGEGRINAQLRRAIEVFDLFACHQSRHGMTLFLGHNALLRTEAVSDAGGLREGVFADDIDLSIRLVRRGWKIHYAQDIPFGETHPISYAAFRRRAYKWAFGCGQILRRHLVPVLLDRRLTFPQKMGLLEFTGFYAIQAVLIIYLILVGIALPLVSDPPPGRTLSLFLSGAAIVLSIFLPSFAYHSRRRRLAQSWPFALICAVVYGSVAFTSARGLLEGAFGRRRRWVPTNLETQARPLSPVHLLESLFGLLLFLIPTVLDPKALWQPSMYLFATVFLLCPFVAVLYVPSKKVDRPAVPGRSVIQEAGRARLWILLAAVVAASLSLLTMRSLGISRRAAVGVTISGDRILVDGEPFLVRGIHYSPWLPGTGPMKHHRWPDEATVERDLAMIRHLGANTILVHDAPRSIFTLAQHHDLRVIYAYFINWQSVTDEALFERRTAEIVRSVDEVSREPSLLAILLGNEVVEWVLKQQGRNFVEARLRSLYEHVKRVAPGVLVSHANWPVTRLLDLSYMDLACFNLYPAWPREVVVAGYGNYIENVLKPIAAGRPLLITEFGQNSLEATDEKQAQVLRESWAEIQSRTAGGVVFSFADEWWKNYDNPVPGGSFWERVYAPDDEKTHELDPEEYYGIVTSERAPKPAYAAVRQMFQEDQGRPLRAWIPAFPLLALVLYTVYVFLRREEKG